MAVAVSRFCSGVAKTAIRADATYLVVRLSRALVAGPVDAQAALRQHLSREIRWEAALRMQPEELCAWHEAVVARLDARERAQASRQHTRKAALLLREHLRQRRRSLTLLGRQQGAMRND